MRTRNRPGPLLTDLYQLTMGCSYWRSGMMRDGVRCDGSPPLTEMRERCRAQLSMLPPAVRALREPGPYFVGMNGERVRRRLFEEKR